MKKFLSIFLLTFLLVFSLCGCYTDIAETGTDSFPDFKIALAVGEGGIEDDGFNSSAWDALNEFARQTGATVECQIAEAPQYYYRNIELLAESEKNYDVIWCMGYDMQEQAIEVAKKTPDKLFAIIDTDVTEGMPSNVICVNLAAEQSAFLSGYIAGNMTKTNALGFIKGRECPSNDAFEYGFKAGAMYAGKELGKDVRVYTSCINTFSDQSVASVATEELISRYDVDIVHQCAGSAGIGAILKCQEKGIYAIGVDKDQSDVAPGTVITSSIKHVGSAIYSISMGIARGELLGGTYQVLGMDTGHTGISTTSEQTVPEELMRKVNSISDKIKSGAISVPSSEKQYSQFIGEL